MKPKAFLTIAMFLITIHMYGQSSKIIAHRGAWLNTKVPENSIASLQQAAQQKVWGCEFDVHLTKDNILVVNHDNDFYGMDIATSTYQELKTIKHPNGEYIPTVEEYIIEGMKHPEMKLIYELKTNRLGTQRTLEAVAASVELVKKLKASKQVEYIAFSFDACLEFKKLDENSKVHYLSGDKSPQDIKQAGLTGIDYNLQVFKNKPTWIHEAKELGLKTNVWTVNQQKDMTYFIQQNVDYITTDETEKLAKLIHIK